MIPEIEKMGDRVEMLGLALLPTLVADDRTAK